MTKVAINGFGRIGRNVLKSLIEKQNHPNPEIAKKYRDIQVVFINDLTSPSVLAHLLKYDSVHRGLALKVESTENSIIVNGQEIAITAIKNPAELPHSQYGVDIVIESTGLFTEKEKMSLHLQAGAKKVILSAPAKDEIDLTVVLGVNSYLIKPTMKLFSNASCTTNCLAPLAMAMHETFGIKRGFMNTIHSYTNDQNLLDLAHRDLRRARAAAINIVPSTTGAAKAIGLVIPELKGKMDGLAVRVPTPDGSMLDLSLELEKEASKEEINSALKAYSQKPELNQILEYCQDEIVSSDVLGNGHSCIFDSTLTQIIDPAKTGKSNFIKVFAWYDNEWGYSNRVVDLLGMV